MRSGGRVGALVGALSLGFGLPACADFSPLDSGTCGNTVVDGNEDCDTYAEGMAMCGAPGAPNACRYVCGGSTRATCPPGWGCGHDGVCRLPKGTFTAFGEPVPFASPHTLVPGDFDGNKVTDILVLGQQDTLGLASARIVYPPTVSAPASITALPEPIAAPAVGDFDKDGVDDIAYGRLDGVSVITGRSDRNLQNQPFPTYVPIEAMRLQQVLPVLPTSSGDDVVYFLDDAKEGPSLWWSAPGAMPGQPVHIPDTLTGSIVWGTLDETAGCPQLVLPSSGHVSLFTPCVPGTLAWNDGGAFSPVVLPAAASAAGTVLITDLDGDGHADLLIDAGGPFAAYGRGDGTFTSQPKNGGTPGMADAYGVPSVNGSTTTVFPLAARDVNGDGMIDVVAPDGLVISGPAGYAYAYKNQGKAWTQAVLFDVNADGLVDVAAGSSDAVDIDFLINAGGGAFNPSTLPTSGPTSLFAVGDYDGDLLLDLAFVQTLQAASGLENDLTIAFGASHETPAAAVTMASVAGVVELAPARLVSSVSASTNAIDELLVVSTEGMAGRFFAFGGDGSRTLTSPLALATLLTKPGAPPTPDVPVALSAGGYDSADPTADLAIVGADKTGALHLWEIEVTTALSAKEIHTSNPVPGPFHPAGGGSGMNFLYAAYAASGDIDHDMNHTAELVVVAPYNGSPGTAPGTAALVVADFDATKAQFFPRAAQAFTATLSADASLRLVDVDGDGFLDAVLTAADDGDLLIFWNHAGTLDVSSPARIQTTPGVRDFACLVAPDGKGCDLVLVSTEKVFRARLTGSRQFGTPTAVTDESRTDLPGGQGVVAADFNQDGTTDLVLATPGGLQFYLSPPVRE